MCVYIIGDFDLYDALNLTRDASPDDVRTAPRRSSGAFLRSQRVVDYRGLLVAGTFHKCYCHRFVL